MSVELHTCGSIIKLIYFSTSLTTITSTTTCTTANIAIKGGEYKYLVENIEKNFVCVNINTYANTIYEIHKRYVHMVIQNEFYISVIIIYVLL